MKTATVIWAALAAALMGAAPQAQAASKYDEMHAKLTAANFDMSAPEVVFGLAGYKVSDAPAGVYPPAAPIPVGDAPYIDADGAAATVARHAGSPALLIYWGTWCGACALEMEAVEALVKDYKDGPLKVIPIAVRDQRPQVERHLRKFGWSHIGLATDPLAKGFAAQSLQGTPSHVLVNAKSEAVLLIEGPLDWGDKDVRGWLDRFAKTETEGAAK